MKKTIRQHDITDCGAACLASIAAHYQLQLPIARIRQYAGTDKQGTNILGLIEAAQRLGFQAKGVKGPIESLVKIPLPAIAHVIKGNLQHYVVIYETGESYLKIMDPADGKMHSIETDAFKKEWTGILVLLLPEADFVSGDKTLSLFRRFWNLVKPHRSIMLQSLAGAIVYTILGLASSIYMQKIVDDVLTNGNTNLLNLLSIVMIFILLVQMIIGNAKSIFVLKTGQHIDATLILGYYKHLLKLPQQFFDTMRVGEIISRVNDAVKIRSFINDVSINFVVNAFIVIFSFVLMFTYYWKLALILLAVLPLYLFLYWLSNRINKKQLRHLMENSALLETQLVESLNAVSTIKRFGLEEFSNNKTESKFIQLLRSIYQSTISSVYIGSAADFISRLFTIILLWSGSYFVIRRELSPGELLSFYALLGYFTGPAISLIGMNRSVQDALIAADRLFEIMDLEREETTQKVTLNREMIGDIHFRNITFRYGTRTQVFTNLSLCIPKGKVTAVIGESGSGKSTLLSLLQNIYTLSEGSITIGDYNLKNISNESLRQLVSVVPQQVDLFAGNFIENIAVGDYEPDMKKLLDIAAALGITSFVESIPNGFYSYIGENGVSLSGGQRQRIAIARALYKDPEILILDEATSSLDSNAEYKIQETINRFRQQEKTVIIIAHRLSTIREADKIIVLQAGSVVEEGNHQSLMESDSLYKKMKMQQMD